MAWLDLNFGPEFITFLLNLTTLLTDFIQNTFMEEKACKARKYLISFKEDANWLQLFQKFPSERDRIDKAYLKGPNTWKVAFNERRVERAVRNVYGPFTSDIKMTGDDYKLFDDDKKPLFIVTDLSQIYH